MIEKKQRARKNGSAGQERHIRPPTTTRQGVAGRC